MPLVTKNWDNFQAVLDQSLSIQQVKSMGYDSIWKKGVICPNRLIKKEEHDLNCKVCDGTGFLYDNSGEMIKALVTSIGLKQMWQTFGRFDVGMGIITVSPEHRLSWWDMIEFPTSTIRYSQIMQRGSDGLFVDKAKYGVVEMVRAVDPLGVDFVCGHDFEITIDGKLDWNVQGGRKPSAGSFYSVSYLCHPRYIVVELVHQIRKSPSKQGGVLQSTEFPIQAIGKLDFLIGDESVK